MANRGRVPPPHLRRPLPGHPDPYVSGAFPPFEMMPPPPDLMEQKLSAQHMEIQKLATENQRLAATHGNLRQELATASNDLQSIHAHIAETKSQTEQQARGILDKISMMEPQLKAAQRIKTELQQARAEAQSLIAARQELVSKVQQLTRDLQMSHSEALQIPSLMSELDSLRQEYQQYRGTYEYENKLYIDHLESLKVMEKNYMAMSREVEKLRAELTNSSSFDPRTGRPYTGSGGYSDSFTMGNYASSQNAYAVAQGQSPLQGGGSGVKAAVGGTSGASGAGGKSPQVVSQSAPTGSVAARDTSKVPDHNASRASDYDSQRGHVGTGYDPQKGHTGAGFDAHRLPTGPNHNAQRGPSGPGYDAQMRPSGPAYDPMRPTGSVYDPMRPTGPGYNAHWRPGAASAYGSDIQRGGYEFEVQRTQPVYDGHRAPPAYNMQRGSGNDIQRGGGGNHNIQKNTGYDPSSRNSVGPSGGQISAPTPSSRAGSGHESASRGANPVRK